MHIYVLTEVIDDEITIRAATTYLPLKKLLNQIINEIEEMGLSEDEMRFEYPGHIDYLAADNYLVAITECELTDDYAAPLPDTYLTRDSFKHQPDLEIMKKLVWGSGNEN